jgi:hypothetical protein
MVTVILDPLGLTVGHGFVVMCSIIKQTLIGTIFVRLAQILDTLFQKVILLPVELASPTNPNKVEKHLSLVHGGISLMIRLYGSARIVKSPSAMQP